MTRVIGHRGATDIGAGRIDNTLPAFRHAIDAGADGIECDLRLLADGHVAIVHDVTLAGITGDDAATGVIDDMTAADLARIRPRGGPEPIPLLDDLLALVAGTRMELHLELKADQRGRPYPGLAAATLARLDAGNIAGERLVFTSFFPDILAEMRLARPSCRIEAAISLRTVARYGSLRAAIAAFDRLPGCTFSFASRILAWRWERCSALGLDRIGVWTVNAPDKLRVWMDRGVRHIITDVPELAIGVRDRAAVPSHRRRDTAPVESGRPNP